VGRGSGVAGYSYDGVGNLTSKTDRKNQMIAFHSTTFTYDAAHQKV